MNDGYNMNPAAWWFVPTAWFFPAPVPATPAVDSAPKDVPPADGTNLRDIFGLPPEPPAEPTPEAEPVRRIKFREFL